MGAYEFPGAAASCLIRGDANGDGAVNVLDVIELLLCFGLPADPPARCSLPDFNVDGTVNVLDLIQLLLAFGQTCP